MPEPDARSFAIATPHRLATQSGEAAFAAGGNAVDAALAAACALTVVYPHMCAVGGDVMALVHDGAAHAVNGSGRAPRTAPAGKYPVPRSVDAITVPGAVSAWQTIGGALGHPPSGRRAEGGGRAGPRRRPDRALAGTRTGGRPAGCDGRRGALKAVRARRPAAGRVRHACAGAAGRNAGAARQRWSRGLLPGGDRPHARGRPGRAGLRAHDGRSRAAPHRHRAGPAPLRPRPRPAHDGRQLAGLLPDPDHGGSGADASRRPAWGAGAGPGGAVSRVDGRPRRAPRRSGGHDRGSRCPGRR